MVEESQQVLDAGAERDPQTRLNGVDFWIAAGVTSIALGVYVFTLAPGLLRADGGEFQTLAATLGYAHPTGSPVYLLIAWPAARIPLGDVPYRVNLLSAVMGAVAVGLLYLLGKLLTGRRWVPLAGAAALAVSPTFWSQAVVAGVHTSAIAFMVAVFLCFALWLTGARRRWLFAGACLGVMSLGVHPSVGLMAPAALVVVVLTPGRWLANWAVAILGTLLGLAVLLGAYAVIDRADSPTSYFRTVIGPSRSAWGLQKEDLDDFQDRLKLSVSPPQYRGRLFCTAPGVPRQRAIDYLKNLPREFPPLWLIGAAGGLLWLARKTWKTTLLVVLTWGAHLLFDLHYGIGEVHLLYLAGYVPVALFGVAGLALVNEVATGPAGRQGNRRRASAFIDAALGITGLAVVISPMLFPGAWNVEGRRHCWVPPEEEPFRVEYSAAFHDEVRALVDDLEDDAVLFTDWCYVYPCYYVAHVEQNRAGMVFIQDYPHPYRFELADSALEYVKQASPIRPVYFTHVVGKVAKVFELEPVEQGGETLYRVGKPIPPAEAPGG